MVRATIMIVVIIVIVDKGDSWDCNNGGVVIVKIVIMVEVHSY